MFQQRVCLLARVLVGFGVVIQLFVRWLAQVAKGNDFASGADWTPNLHLLVLGFCILAWVRTRAGRRSERELQLWDVSCVIAPSVFSLYVMWGVPATVGPSLVNEISIGNVLILRAVLVPSSGRRTAALGAGTGIGLVAWSYAYGVAHAATMPAPPWMTATNASLWSAMNLALTTIASHTIFGLRQKVREATELGQYTLLREIGAGGMGVVYEARHALLRRRTAVKLLPADRAGEQNILRFEREVQLTASLTHPNTIAIYDYGRSPDGVFYYAMEYLDGIDLEVLIGEKGPQHPGLVAHVLEQVCAALAEAHSVGLIHRDIKPANVFLCQRGGIPGFAKVVDFGLVKQLASHDEPALSGGRGAILGTPLYLSPEAITHPDQVDAKSDLYAVGALAYCMLTGRPVFEAATTFEICGHHLYSRPPAPSERLGQPVAPALEALVLQCLQKDPNARPESAATLAATFAELRAELGWNAEHARVWWRDCQALAERRREPVSALATTRQLTVELKRR